MEPSEMPPAPGEVGWEDWVEDQLSDVTFDTELGKSMAEDAFCVARGDLSKKEFHERHHEAVKAEFGVDERPTKREIEAPEDENDPHPKVPGSNRQTRRRVLSALGGVTAAAAGSLSGCLGVLDGENDEPTGNELGGGIIDQIPGQESEEDDGIIDEIPHQKQLGMVVDTERCVACLSCSEACKEENNTDIGVHWPYVFRYHDEHAGNSREGFLTRHCQHCSEPSCTFVCPTQARYKRTDDGVVLTDYDTCIGCRYCQVACPYGVNYLGQDEPNENISDGFDGDPVGRDGRTVGGPPPMGVMGKCTFCVHRQDSGDPDLVNTTACEQRCPFGALHFGDMNDPNSDPRQHLREKGESNQFKLLEDIGNEPNIVFVGQAPSMNAEPVQGPVAYEDKGMKDGNYDYVLGASEGEGGYE